MNSNWIPCNSNMLINGCSMRVLKWLVRLMLNKVNGFLVLSASREWNLELWILLWYMVRALEEKHEKILRLICDEVFGQAFEVKYSQYLQCFMTHIPYHLVAACSSRVPLYHIHIPWWSLIWNDDFHWDNKKWKHRYNLIGWGKLPDKPCHLFLTHHLHNINM